MVVSHHPIDELSVDSLVFGHKVVFMHKVEAQQSACADEKCPPYRGINLR